MQWTRELNPEEGSEEEKCLQRRARTYLIINDKLYKAGVYNPFLRCIAPDERCQLLSEIHQGAYGSHTGFRSMVAKAYRQGFYWPTVVKDAQSIVRTCAGCQYNAKTQRVPTRELQVIPLVWPLARWGIDIVGLLPKA